MDDRTVGFLADLNKRFYERNATSFNSTRHGAWPGWKHLEGSLEHLLANVEEADRVLRVLDVACGNMRFAEFLSTALPDRKFSYSGLDSCDDLIPEGRRSCFEHRDLIAELAHANDDGTVNTASFDLVVCFGFFHHVPGYDNRVRLMQRLVSATRPGGLVAASFWKFLDDPRLAEKARDATARCYGSYPGLESRLEAGDCFLGWQKTESLRYCHAFGAVEVDELACSVKEDARLVDRYCSDGRSGTLNEYLVLRAL